MGPLTHQWCMRYESIHGYLKRKAVVSCNFRNMPFTLAMQYQYKLSDNILNDCFLRKFTSPGSIKRIALQHVDAELGEEIQKIAGPQVLKIKTCTSIVHNGQNYKPGEIVLANIANSELLEPSKFCQIKYIVELNGDWYFAVGVLKTVAFSTHLHAYRVEKGKDVSLVRVTNLVDHHPLNMYHFCKALLIRLRWKVNAVF